jgi:hypothetical protein
MEDREAKFKKVESNVYAIKASILKFKKDKNILHDYVIKIRNLQYTFETIFWQGFFWEFLNQRDLTKYS